MPNILVKIPANTFDGDARAALARRITHAAAQAEQIADDPRSRATTWVLVEEVPAGAWWCGGADMSAHIVPCLAIAHVPAGVLDAAARALPGADGRRVVTSVMLHDVADGTWGVNGALWALPDFARAAGYAHLQHLVAQP